MTIKQILEMKQERALITNSIRALMNEFENTEMPAEKKEELARIEAKFDDLNAKIISEEKQLERERAIGEVVDKEKPAKQNETRDLFAKALSGNPRHIETYQNALSLGSDATAGYLTAPVEFVQELIKGLDNVLFMRKISRIVGPIGAAQSLGFPFVKTEAVDASWTAEVDPAAEETTLEFGRREFKPNKLAKLIKLSKTLVSHAPMAEGVVLQEIINKIATAQENGYLNGNGTGQPLGIFTAHASGIPTTRDVSTGNTATTITFDGLMEARGALKQQYRAGSQWVMHRDLEKQLAKIKDGEGQYIWNPSLVAEQPDRLLGFAVNLSEYAPNTYTAGLYAAVLGNFAKGYWIADADNLAIQVLKELYAVNNQIGYLVDYFGDGAPVDPNAFVRVKLG
jgi:HK97 family phage major capsid protein